MRAKNLLKKAAALALILGVFVVVTAPYIGLGAHEDFFLYRAAGIPRGYIMMFLVCVISFFIFFIAIKTCVLVFWNNATPKSAGDADKKAALIAATLTLSIVLFLIGLKGIDLYIQKTSANPWYDAQTDRRTIRAYDLYPYDGFHLQANYHHVGPMPWEELYDTFDVQSGSHGFFVDFDLDHPPPKNPNEFRIILTGGSGAQGWGAQDNAHMLYTVLEHGLNKSVGHTGVKVRVINLAMGGSVTYQNFIALNRWGHDLQPDMIVSYSGANDITVPESSRSNVYNANFFDLRGLMMTSFYSESPAYVKYIAAWFPGIVKQTRLGAMLRFFSLKNLTRQQTDEYNAGFGFNDLPSMYDRKLSHSVIMDKISIPEYVHALQSIRRDFPGIPIFVVRQVIDWRRVAATLDMESDYNHFWKEAVKNLENYGDGPWSFIDMQDYFQKRGYFGPQYRASFVHLDNDKVKLVVPALVPEISEFIIEGSQQSASNR